MHGPSASDDLAVQLCQRLVQIPSVNPEDNPGTPHTGEAACVHWLAHWVRSEFPDALVLTPEVLPGRPNLVVQFASQPKSPPNSRQPQKPRLLFAPHTDTVSVAGMTIDPFGGVLKDNRLWGRGASDTKGPMASMLAALRARKHLLPKLSHEIWFAALVGEEAGQHGAHALASTESFDLVLAAEPTELQFVHTHKGSLFLTLTSRGIAAHGARPELGSNAIHPMAEVLLAVRDQIAPWLASFIHPVLGPSTVNTGTIRGGSKTNIVPDFCEATLDLRTVPGQHDAFFEDLCRRLRQIHPELEIQAHRSDPLFTDPSHPLLQKLRSLGSSPVGAPWFCDAAVFAQHGSPAVAIGPGSITQAHTKDEWIAIEDLHRGTQFFCRFLDSLQ
jgi:acetylornithine deacetylase/succinyl-diaminopimelate desuccinylase-like protein